MIRKRYNNKTKKHKEKMVVRSMHPLDFFIICPFCSYSTTSYMKWIHTQQTTLQMVLLIIISLLLVLKWCRICILQSPNTEPAEKHPRDLNKKTKKTEVCQIFSHLWKRSLQSLVCKLRQRSLIYPGTLKQGCEQI